MRVSYSSSLSFVQFSLFDSEIYLSRTGSVTVFEAALPISSLLKVSSYFVLSVSKVEGGTLIFLNLLLVLFAVDKVLIDYPFRILSKSETDSEKSSIGNLIIVV